MNKEQVYEQFAKAIQMFCQSLTDESAMEVAIIYPPYKVGKLYKPNEMFTSFIKNLKIFIRGN